MRKELREREEENAKDDRLWVTEKGRKDGRKGRGKQREVKVGRRTNCIHRWKDGGKKERKEGIRALRSGMTESEDSNREW